MSDEQEQRPLQLPIGYASHNNRVVAIRSFCMHPPRIGNPEFLRLAVAGDTGEYLCSYSKDDCVRDAGETIPEAISSALQDHADAVQTEVQAVLAWCRADGSTVLTKRLRARPVRDHMPAVVPGMSLQESAAIIGNGDGQAVVGQVLRTSEVYMRSYLQGHHLQGQQARELTEAAMEQAKMSGTMAMDMYSKLMEAINAQAKLTAENIRLQAECDAKDRQIAELTLLLEGPGVPDEEADGPETDSAKAELVRQVGEQLEAVIPDAVQLGKLWLMSQVGKNNAAAANAARAAAQAANGAVNGHAVE